MSNVFFAVLKDMCSQETVCVCNVVSLLCVMESRLSHCCRRLKKRAAEKVSRPKVNVSASGRYTVTRENPPSSGVCTLCTVLMTVGFLSGVDDSQPLPPLSLLISHYDDVQHVNGFVFCLSSHFYRRGTDCKKKTDLIKGTSSARIKKV